VQAADVRLSADGAIIQLLGESTGGLHDQGAARFVYTIVWEDFRIRSLHPAGVLIDPRSVNGGVIVDIDGLSAIEHPESLDASRMGEMPEEGEGFGLPEDFTPPDDDEFGLWRADEDE
jgi:hypothetical protein